LYEAKRGLRKLILLLSFSQWSSLHLSAYNGRLEVSRLLVESKADVAARNKCFSPPPSHHLSLTICLAGLAKLHSNWPSTTTKPTWLHTCAASARRNDALLPLLRPSQRTVNAVLLQEEEHSLVCATIPSNKTETVMEA
jgi:ankyrin repeat protein